MIIWIASYPKSGNTWIRALISAYLYSKDEQFDFNDLNKIEQFPSKKYLSPFLKNFDDPTKVPNYWLPAQRKINSENKNIFFKTHNQMCTINGYQFTNKENTIGCIYIVRDPRNVITSLANHYGLSIEKAYEFFTNKRKIIFNQDNLAIGKVLIEKGNAHFVGSWDEHYLSWKNIQFAKVKIIKYEDLIKDTYGEFLSTLKFLNNFVSIKINEKKIKKIIQSCNFDILKKKEAKEGFFEAPVLENNKKIVFFNLGKNNNWKKILDKVTEEKIRKKFSKEMKELGYM